MAKILTKKFFERPALKVARWYVYFTYGMHWMLNIVTGPKNYPAAVLIRGVCCKSRDPISGLQRWDLCLNDKRFNNKPASRLAGLWIAAPSGRASLRKFGAGRLKIKRTPRIGVGYAGEWAGKPYRFCVKF